MQAKSCEGNTPVIKILTFMEVFLLEVPGQTYVKRNVIGYDL